MFEDIKIKQPNFYSMIKKAVELNKLSHAYLIETNGVDDSDSIVFAFIKYILTFNVDEKEKIINLINNNNYPDIKIIDSLNKEIKKEEILKIEHDFSVKPLYGKYLIYYIKNVENFNASSANTILKFLEEPNDNIIAILTTSNLNNVIDTIVSRCQSYSLIPDSVDYLVDLFDSKEEYKNFIDNEFENYINLFCDIEENKLSLIGNKDIYMEKNDLKVFLYVGLYFYMDLLYNKLGLEKKLNFKYDNKNKMLNLLTVDSLMNRINVMCNYVDLNILNLNKDLFIDNLICDLCGGIYD